MKKHTVDMTRGNIFRLIIAFALPIMVSGILQTLYNAADMIVVGKFAGKESLAAVGSTSSAINLMLNIFVGISSATNVIVARKFGAGNKSGVSKTVHTAMAACIGGGVLITIAGILFSKQILIWMDSPSDVIELSALYMRIYFLGISATLLYNFGSAILRAVGDSKRPTYFLMLSGVINVVLNLVFVIVFHMGVAGVAVATVISQCVAAALVLRCLIKTDECFKLNIKKIALCAAEFKEMLMLGIPAGIQGSIFSISNILIQSSINSVGSDAMAGSSAAISIEGVVYIAMNTFFHATLTFISQNYGAHNFKRMRKGFWTGFFITFVVGATIGALVVCFDNILVGFYTDIPHVIDIACERLRYICLPYFLCGMMEVGTGALRGIGVATRAMIVCVIGVCGVRVFTVMTNAPYNEVRDLIPLYYSYPISWVITTTLLTVIFFLILRKREKEWLQHIEDKAVNG
ncbi:MAG: MATE family efflux transporter [Ruminococcaceae bacterium]|nr:MATE family efflux transporter [Oscillospiraceae bacterium]